MCSSDLVVSGAPDLPALHTALAQALGQLLGPLPLTIEPLQADDKVRQYTSDLAGAHVDRQTHATDGAV